jgi:Type IV secretion-system coupling protein DNA-binding domain
MPCWNRIPAFHAPRWSAWFGRSVAQLAHPQKAPEQFDAQGKSFSTAEWYTERKRSVFLTSSADYREKLLPLHSVWLDLLILRTMGYCEDYEAKPVWFVLDELASLNKLPQLHTAVTEHRKYGNPVVLGFQGRSQLEKRYGQDAEAMLSQPRAMLACRQFPTDRFHALPLWKFKLHHYRKLSCFAAIIG